MNTIAPDEILRRIHNLPSLPTVVMELLASVEQEDVNIDALVKKIAQDQALTAKTLRLANSSFYGMAHQVTTIQEAIAILGFRTVRSLATTAALIGTFARSTHTSFNVTPFWRHAIAAAVCARELAVHLKLNPEHAYTAGLLHDIGRLVLVTHFQAPYEATMAHRAQHDCNLLDAEHAVLGVDHAWVGHVLTRHWKFPEAMQQAVACHHAPLNKFPRPRGAGYWLNFVSHASRLDYVLTVPFGHCRSHTPQGAGNIPAMIQGAQPLSMVVLAANAIAHALDLSMDMDDLVPAVPMGLWKQLGLDEKALREVFENTEKQFEGASLIFNT